MSRAELLIIRVWWRSLLGDLFKAAKEECKVIFQNSRADANVEAWNPVSHSEYWKDDYFTETVAKVIGGFV
jgi:hypothetical protein